MADEFTVLKVNFQLASELHKNLDDEISRWMNRHKDYKPDVLYKARKAVLESLISLYAYDEERRVNEATDPQPQ